MRRERSGSAWPAAWIFYLMAEDCLLAGLARRIEEFLDCCHSAALIATIHKASIPGPERVLDPAFPLPRLAALLCLSFFPPTLPAVFAHRHSAFGSHLEARLSLPLFPALQTYPASGLFFPVFDSPVPSGLVSVPHSDYPARLFPAPGICLAADPALHPPADLASAVADLVWAVA